MRILENLKKKQKTSDNEIIRYLSIEYTNGIRRMLNEVLQSGKRNRKKRSKR